MLQEMYFLQLRILLWFYQLMPAIARYSCHMIHGKLSLSGPYLHLVGLMVATEKVGPWRLVDEGDQHDQEVVERQPLEQIVTLVSQRVSLAEQQQGNGKVGCMNDIILHSAEGDHSYEHHIHVVPACKLILPTCTSLQAVQQWQQHHPL